MHDRVRAAHRHLVVVFYASNAPIQYRKIPVHIIETCGLGVRSIMGEPEAIGRLERVLDANYMTEQLT